MNVFSGITIDSSALTTGIAPINYQYSGQNYWSVYSNTILEEGNETITYNIHATDEPHPIIQCMIGQTTFTTPFLFSGLAEMDMSNPVGNINLIAPNKGINLSSKWIKSFGPNIRKVSTVNEGVSNKTGFLATGANVIVMNTNLLSGDVTGVLRNTLPIGIEYTLTNEGSYPLKIRNSGISGVEIIEIANTEGNYKSVNLIKISNTGWIVSSSHLIGSFLMLG